MWIPIVLTLLLMAGSEADAVNSPAGLDQPPRYVVERLRRDSGNTLEISWNPETGTPVLLTGELTKPSKHSPQWIAYGFLDKAKPLYGLKRVAEDVKVLRTEQEKDGTVRLRMQRMLYGNPVCGDELAVEMDSSGVVRRVSGVFHAGLEKKRLNRPMVPVIYADKALEIASGYMKEQGIAGQPEVSACYMPNREGIPLVYTVAFREKTGAARTVAVHSVTGLVFESPR